MRIPEAPDALFYENDPKNFGRQISKKSVKNDFFKMTPGALLGYFYTSLDMKKIVLPPF